MPRGGRKKAANNAAQNDEPKPDPHEILHNLIQKARNLTDHDIWNHALGGKQSKNRGKIRATEKEEDEELLHEAELSSTRYFHLQQQPSLIAHGKLREYQLEGVSWLINLRNNGLHGILADEMGLGKTLQTITLLAYLREFEDISGVHLIVVPKSTIINWCREFAKWCPSFSVFALEANSKPERLELVKEHLKCPGGPKMNVIICSYEICMIEKAALRGIHYEYIIVDEAHRLKNNASKFSRILRSEFTSSNRLLITGTPLQNNLCELWSLLNFLLPNLFESASDFEAMFDFGKSDDEQARIFQQLRTLLKPFLLRRLKKNVTSDLPPKTELILFVGMTELQRDIYKKLLLKDMSLLSGDAKKTSLLNLVMQLRKCTNHPYLFDGVEDRRLDPFGEHLIANCGKLLLLDKLLKKLYSAGSRVLIFSQMTRILDILEDYCSIRKYKYCRIDGSTSGEDRQTAMDDFNAPNSNKFLFLLTTRAGGLGINLQTADIVIIYDSDWNPQMDLQAMDRAHRIGQTKPVFVYRLVTKDTVEQRILERAELKLRLDAMVIQKHNRKAGGQGGASGGGGASNNRNEELMEMIQYGADKIFKSNSSMITDDDIDTILSVSQSDTQKLKDKWQKKVKKEFSELTLEFNYQQYEGQDYTQARKERTRKMNEEKYKLLAVMNESMTDSKTGGVRSTRLATQIGGMHKVKRSYNEDAYYRDKLNAARAALASNNTVNSNNVNQLTPPERLPDIRYWQLYDAKSLYVINAKEWEWFNKWKNHTLYDEEKHIALSPEEEQLKQELLEQGFDRISYRDFNCFVRLCIKHGKDNIDVIADELVKQMENVGETQEEKEETKAMVKRYHAAFFEKAEEIEELEPALQRIADGEKRRLLRLEREKQQNERRKERRKKQELWEAKKREAALRREEKKQLMAQRAREQEEKFKAALESRMTKWKTLALETNDGVYKELQIPDAKCTDRGFSKELDRCLFMLTYEYGYGEWPKVHEELLKHVAFQFDFFVKTLKPSNIKYRMDTILRACISSKKSTKRVLSREGSMESTTKKIGNVDLSSAKKQIQEPPKKRRKIVEAGK